MQDVALIRSVVDLAGCGSREERHLNPTTTLGHGPSITSQLQPGRDESAGRFTEPIYKRG